MRAIPVAVIAILLSFGSPASAHRLDEYLQATTISIDSNRVQAEMRLTPGVAVLSKVLAAIDTNGDGALSEPEQRAYAERVLRDLSLTMNGVHLPLRLISSRFAGIAEMKEGRGDIQLEFRADLPRTSRRRTLVLENHHQSRISVYLVNCLVPSDPAIQITEQKRNYQQSIYQLDYSQADAPLISHAISRRSRANGWIFVAAVLPIALLAALGWRIQRQSGLSGKHGA